MKEEALLNQDTDFMTGLFKELSNSRRVEVKGDTLYINNAQVDLNEEQYKNVKKVRCRLFSFEVLSHYLKYDVDITFTIPISFKPEEREFLYKYENVLKNVRFYAGNKTLSIGDMKKLDETMDLMVKDIKESDLSPYEKFLAAYDIVKSYKAYEENYEEKSLARSTYAVIVGDYAVCVGYVNFLNELLSRLSINSDELTCNATTGAHSIAIVHIKDPKYGYDGFQLTDPTVDVIQKDYKQKPLIQNYIVSNYTFDEGMSYFYRIDASPFFYEKDPNKMLKYMKGKFGEFYLKTAFNEITQKLIETLNYDYKDDKPLSIFKELLDEIGYDNYDIEDAKKTISYIQERMNKKISYETRLEAIYNVNKFINQDNVSFTDFVCDNLSIIKQFPTEIDVKVNEELMKQIDEVVMRGILKTVKMVANTGMSIDLLKETKDIEMFNTKLTTGIMLQESLFEAGVLPYNNKLLIKNSLVNNDLKSMTNETIKYDEKFNALYIDITPELEEMSFKEFKEYLKSLLNEKTK